MTLSHLGTIKLSSMPKIRMLLLKAALKKSSFSPQKPADVTLPDNKFYFEGVDLKEPNSRTYHQVVDWKPGSEIIHPCLLHSLAFPLHIMLLLLPEFPFPLLGLIHVNNHIKQLRPITQNEILSVNSCFEDLKLHPKGWLFSIKVEFYSDTELVWQSISTNLFRVKHTHVVDPKTPHSIHCFVNPIITTRKLRSNLGRRYAKVSGDYNPIHLSKFSAKLFGFKQHIVHGMWTKSYCISVLQKINPSIFMQAFEIDSTFKQPLYLPNEIKIAVHPIETDSAFDAQYFKVIGIDNNNEKQPLYLMGKIRTI